MLNIPNPALKDPVPELIEKLASENAIKVKIQTNLDNLNLQEQKKDLIRITAALDAEDDFGNKFPDLSRLFLNKRSPNFPNQEQKCLINKLKHIPCYTVVNNRNEIVMASPRMHKEYSSLEWLQNKCYELFYWSGDRGSVSLSLFFMNKEDAATYLHEICKREPKESEINGLKIKTTGLDVFYKFNRTSPPRNQTKLICDLHEIDVLLNQYIKNSENNVHSKQKYSTSWFQGTPVYSFRTYTDSKKKELLEYSFDIKNGKKLIFFNREDAIKAWKYYLFRTNQIYLKSLPNLEIYNLESLLLDLENSKSESVLNTIIVPPSSYSKDNNFLETHSECNETSNLEKQLYKTKLKLKEIQRFYKGLIWLFTSDTLPSEENSW